ncbi:MAG: hypothetical protein RIM84_01765 [Alphaproteobacteria bacterium]
MSRRLLVVELDDWNEPWIIARTYTEALEELDSLLPRLAKDYAARGVMLGQVDAQVRWTGETVQRLPLDRLRTWLVDNAF